MGEENRTPLHPNKRILSLDVMRGISLLGIFLVNMISFHSPYLYYDPYHWWNSPSDYAHYAWIDVLVQASFYPLFAMLFGYSMSLQQERLKQNFFLLESKRLLVLMVAGILHIVFIWSGDILLNYSVCGFLLLLFMKGRGRTLIIFGSVLYLIPHLFLSILLIMTSIINPESTAFWSDMNGIQHSIQAYSTGSFWSITKQRLVDWYSVNGSTHFFSVLLSIFPMFLIGAGAGKLHLVESIEKHKKLNLTLLLMFMAAGIFLKLLPFFFGQNMAYQYVQDSLGGPLLSVAYALAVMIIVRNPYGQKYSKWIAQAGRMSLTNYLFQSVIGSLLFYHYGLALYGKMDLITGSWLAFTLYLIQLILSEMWLSKFQQGPLENVWKMLVYGRKTA
ncbi:DUF418 domain-containing protein [Bacillus smithii]|uniref:DUF418 domain-containing protein n=1 Tax=Bacillus smithii TaxID=1479 RepID=UPI00065E7237|nr:DUF418 domain-containing protein [Bacillus smithii]AKP46348.1 membrane proteinputative [Bacillus smithii]MED0660753.1 DUF418 domain-containing protein [Bacillus smithii]MED1420616.1 DUF418 domain-containing protein [Bacillus smithii]MED1454983.1 DUF418 domain-containing protein [Bacillus smithii]MED1489963.1 DUF418 domain-containing protein [Bacillus smithii]